jgi:hypothetical protein
MSYHQNIAQTHDIKIAYQSFESMAEIIGSDSNEWNYIHEEIKSR